MCGCADVLVTQLLFSNMCVGVLMFLSLSCYLVIWYVLHEQHKRNHFLSQYRPVHPARARVQKGNQHGGPRYDDLQNRLDMVAHENPL